jgi:hypothetical protein
MTRPHCTIQLLLGMLCMTVLSKKSVPVNEECQSMMELLSCMPGFRMFSHSLSHILISVPVSVISSELKASLILETCN